mmetsp:Transcript_19366/g.56640  ORF Transcript_19366/g.56640 Transcript_19366/m.56640 type:complete len:202 (+) Transcript_19366:1076-1681(+)
MPMLIPLSPRALIRPFFFFFGPSLSSEVSASAAFFTVSSTDDERNLLPSPPKSWLLTMPAPFFSSDSLLPTSPSSRSSSPKLKTLRSRLPLRFFRRFFTSEGSPPLFPPLPFATPSLKPPAFFQGSLASSVGTKSPKVWWSILTPSIRGGGLTSTSRGMPVSASASTFPIRRALNTVGPETVPNITCFPSRNGASSSVTKN